VTVADIACGEVSGRDEGLVADAHLVELFVAGDDPPQDGDRLLDRRLLDVDGLEASLQGRVALDVLPVIVQGSRANALDLAPRKGRFQDVGGIQASLGSARTDDRVELVDEENAAGLPRFIHDALQPFLELAPVLRSGHHSAHIEGEQPSVEQLIGHLAAGDPLGQPFNDGCFAHTGVADQRRVVLGAAGEDLDDPLDFGFAADHGVKPAGARSFGQVQPQGVDVGGLALGGLRCGDPGRNLLQHLQDAAPHLIGVRADVVQDAAGHAVPSVQQAEQQVFRADIAVIQPARFVHGVFQRFLGLRGQLAFATDRPLRAAHDELDGVAHFLGIHAHFAEDPRCHPLAFSDQAEEDMFGADIAVVKGLGLFLGQA